MDKIKSFFRYLKRQQFWLICMVIVALGLASWWQFTSELKAEKKSNLSAIDSASNVAQAVGTVAAVEGIEGHPNQIWEAEMDKYMAQIRDEVAGAWQVKDQIQADTLVWPKQLQDDFIQLVQQMRPIESKIAYRSDRGTEPMGDYLKELSGNYLERYANYIELELPKLAEIIKARWAPAAPSGRGGFGGEDMYGGDDAYGGEDMYGGDDAYGGETGYGGEDEMGGGSMGYYDGAGGRRGLGMRRNDGTLVDWSSKNQGELLFNHFDWSNTATKIPSTLQVLYAQEDYWVLKALMQVIAKTNEQATGRHNVKIRQIYFLHIGKDVGPSAGTISDVEVGVAALSGELGDETMGYGEEGGYGEGGYGEGGYGEGGYGEGGYGEGGYGEGGYGEGGYGEGGGDEMYSDEMYSGEGMGGEFGEGGFGYGREGMGGAQVAVDPAERRYVDKNYQPLAGEALRAAMTSTNPEDAYLAVAKRMPVRMRFQMDQRAIPRLLLACSNSPLTIEVRQVRVYRDPAKMIAASRSSGMGRMGGGMGLFGDRGMLGGDDGGGFGYGGERSGIASAMKLPTGLDVAVEVYGIIYIYNPVDRSKLGVEGGEEVDQTVSDDDVALRTISRQR